MEFGKKVKVKNVLLDLLIVGILVLTLIPLFWLVSTSFKVRKDYFTYPPTLLPSHPTLIHYKSIQEKRFLHYLSNSIIASLLSTVIAVGVGSLAAYSLARYKFPKNLGKNLGFFILSLRFAPPIAIVIPIYLMFSRLKILDSVLCLIIIYTTSNLPFVIWIMMQFFKDLPKELEEAALIDGCSTFRVFYSIALRLSLPGLAATSVFSLMLAWNEFLFALILTGTKAPTIPVLVSKFIEDRALLWGDMAAVGTMAIIPVMLFVLLLQKYIVRGLTLGAIKE